MRLETFLLIALLGNSRSVSAAPVTAAKKKSRVPAPAPAVVKEPRCQVEVAVDNLRKHGDLYLGQLCYTLFKGKAGFPDQSEQAYTNQCVAVQQDKLLSFVVNDLPCNQDYALALLHDENGNRKLDKNYGLPQEGVGMSNNPSFLRVNSPPYEHVKFTLQPPRNSQVIHLHYFN